MFDRQDGVNDCKLYINDEKLEHTDWSVYLGRMFMKDEKKDGEILRWANVGGRIEGSMKPTERN